MEKASYKIVGICALILCLCIVLNSGSVFAAVSPDFLNVDSIEIIERHGIVEGYSFNLSAEIMPENTVASAVEWSSSNPEAVSCTEDGKITGISAGGYADITCEAKFGSEKDIIRVYCVESIGSPVKSGFKKFSTPIYAAPTASKTVAWHLDFASLIRDFIRIVAPVMKYMVPPGTTANVNEMMLFNSKCEILGKYKSYAYITFDNGSEKRDGFVKYSRLSNIPEDFLALSAKNMNVWGDGTAYSGKILTSNYKGKNKVHWDVADKSIAEINEETGQVTGNKPGKTTITATVDGMTAECTIHSLYRWPQTWKTKTNCNTNLYRADTSEYAITNYMPEGTVFEVYGDNGSSDGWAYGRATINGTYCWGYVPIDKVSTKGTISQYNNMRWLWPVVTPSGKSKADYIYSPYGKRNRGSGMHKGIDITTGNSGEINGYEVVAAFTGTVNYVSRNEDLLWGYCVAITSDESIKDPISGKQFVAIYMHLKNKPEFFIGQTVNAEKLIGYVGTTGDSDGYHLHFEVNNQTGSIYDIDGKEYSEAGRKSYNSLINPVFFFMDDGIRYNPKSAAELYYYKTYWYGND